MPSLPSPRGSLLSRTTTTTTTMTRGGGGGGGGGGLVVVAPGVGDFPEIIVTAYESGGTAGVFRLEQRVPASLAASIDAVINGSLIDGSLIDGSPSAVRRAARTPDYCDGMRGMGRVRGGSCRRWRSPSRGGRRREGIELDLDDGDDDEGGGAVSAGGTLRAAFLLRERDASSRTRTWRSARGIRSVPGVRVVVLEACVSSSADARVVEDALRDADAVDVEKLLERRRRSFRRDFREQVEAAGHPRDGQAVDRPSGTRRGTTSTTTSRCTPMRASGWR